MSDDLSGLDSAKRPRWSLGNLTLLVSAAFLVYMLLAGFILGLLNAGYSLGSSLQLIGASLFLVSEPLSPVLEHLGLWEGDYWSGPSGGGLVVVGLIYLVLLNLPNVSVVLWRRLPRRGTAVGGLSTGSS